VAYILAKVHLCLSFSYPHRSSTAQQIAEALDLDDPSLHLSRSHYQGSASTVQNGVKHFALIFASSVMLSVLQHDTTFLFADATFWTCPRPFEQVMNIMCNYKGVILPVFHVMMTSKSTALYEQIFLRLRAQFQLKPSTFNTDFEAALTKAIKEVFPDCSIHGCFFHFAQAVFRAVMGPSKYFILFHSIFNLFNFWVDYMIIT
jgi:hypothetical protein